MMTEDTRSWNLIVRLAMVKAWTHVLHLKSDILLLYFMVKITSYKAIAYKVDIQQLLWFLKYLFQAILLLILCCSYC